jgi:hypothetical protein
MWVQRDALFIMQSSLQLRHKHMLHTWALFVDLVKAFDTINRELMFQILSKSGIPKSMIYIIGRLLYDENKIKILMGMEKGSMKSMIGIKK